MVKRRTKTIIALVLCLFTAAINIWNNESRSFFATKWRHLHNETKIDHQDVNNSKLILLYTDFFTGPWYLRWSEKFTCPFQCTFTYNKNAMAVTDAVGFHDADMPLELPRRTKQSQIWFYLNLESPVYSKSADYRDVFNWTMSYRVDSDVYAPYGDFQPLTCSEAIEIQNDLRKTDFAVHKPKLVAWVCSNCDAASGRFGYAKKLAEFVRVDIYGSCGRFQCKRGTNSRLSTDCKLKLKQYKFYLAFENSICEDYITEKYWENSLENNLVPVVMGGANYSRVAIPGSYIDVRDFKSVEHLADYLSYLDRNHTAYNEYFQWKNLFKLSIPYMYGCTLCSALNSAKAKKVKVYSSLHQFWNRCEGRVKFK